MEFFKPWFSLWMVHFHMNGACTWIAKMHIFLWNCNFGLCLGNKIMYTFYQNIYSSWKIWKIITMTKYFEYFNNKLLKQLSSVHTRERGMVSLSTGPIYDIEWPGIGFLCISHFVFVSIIMTVERFSPCAIFSVNIIF